MNLRTDSLRPYQPLQIYDRIESDPELMKVYQSLTNQADGDLQRLRRLESVHRTTSGPASLVAALSGDALVPIGIGERHAATTRMDWVLPQELGLPAANASGQILSFSGPNPYPSSAHQPWVSGLEPADRHRLAGPDWTGASVVHSRLLDNAPSSADSATSGLPGMHAFLGGNAVGGPAASIPASSDQWGAHSTALAPGPATASLASLPRQPAQGTQPQHPEPRTQLSDTFLTHHQQVHLHLQQQQQQQHYHHNQQQQHRAHSSTTPWPAGPPAGAPGQHVSSYPSHAHLAPTLLTAASHGASGAAFLTAASVQLQMHQRQDQQPNLLAAQHPSSLGPPVSSWPAHAAPLRTLSLLQQQQQQQQQSAGAYAAVPPEGLSPPSPAKGAAGGLPEGLAPPDAVRSYSFRLLDLSRQREPHQHYTLERASPTGQLGPSSAFGDRVLGGCEVRDAAAVMASPAFPGAPASQRPHSHHFLQHHQQQQQPQQIPQQQFQVQLMSPRPVSSTQALVELRPGAAESRQRITDGGLGAPGPTQPQGLPAAAAARGAVLAAAPGAAAAPGMRLGLQQLGPGVQSEGGDAGTAAHLAGQAAAPSLAPAAATTPGTFRASGSSGASDGNHFPIDTTATANDDHMRHGNSGSPRLGRKDGGRALDDDDWEPKGAGGGDDDGDDDGEDQDGSDDYCPKKYPDAVQSYGGGSGSGSGGGLRTRRKGGAAAAAAATAAAAAVIAQAGIALGRTIGRGRAARAAVAPRYRDRRRERLQALQSRVEKQAEIINALQARLRQLQEEAAVAGWTPSLPPEAADGPGAGQRRMAAAGDRTTSGRRDGDGDTVM